VEAGTSTEIRNIVFPASIPILVHVVDAFGKDVEGASGRFEALNPSQTSHFPRQVSDAAGLLKMDLPTSDQHGIVIEAAGYSSEEAIYKLQPGQAQLTVRMLPVNLARIRVTDAKTGEPMVRFNMQNQIQLDGQWKEVGRIDRQRLDDEGTRSMPFLAGGRCKISRNGYKTMYLPFEAPCTGIHELSLEPVRPVVGKLLRDGKPVGGISLEVCARLVPGMQHPSILDLRGSTTDTQADLIWAQTDATGSFSFDPLEDPDFWYCLRGNDREGHAIEHWFQVNQDEPSVFDLGDLELTPAGTLLGKVTVPDCVRPAGIVFLSDLDTGACATATDPSGRFELTNLAPGTHYLRMQATPGLAPVKREFQFTIEAGQTLEQHFDLRHLELSVRQLQISSQGSPLVNHKVFLRTCATQADWSESALFGITDANGSVAGSTLVGGFASVWVQSPAGETPRKHPTAIVPLTCHALPAIPVAY
jgi:hypothetical protein